MLPGDTCWRWVSRSRRGRRQWVWPDQRRAGNMKPVKNCTKLSPDEDVQWPTMIFLLLSWGCPQSSRIGWHCRCFPLTGCNNTFHTSCLSLGLIYLFYDTSHLYLSLTFHMFINGMLLIDWHNLSKKALLWVVYTTLACTTHILHLLYKVRGLQLYRFSVVHQKDG